MTTRRYFRASVAGGLGLLIVSGVVGCHRRTNSGIAYKTGMTLTQTQALAERQGIPATPKTLQAALPPPDQNAAPLYTELTQLLKAHPLTKADGIVATGVRRLPTPVEVTQAEAVLKSRPELMSLINRAASRPHCVFVRDYSNPSAMMFPEFARMRAAVRLLMARSRVLVQAGKPDEAVRNTLTEFRIGQHAAQDPFLIAYLVNVAVNSLGLRDLEYTLLQTDGDAKVAAQVRDVLDKQYQSPDFAQAMRGETGTVLCMIDAIRCGVTLHQPQTNPEITGPLQKDMNTSLTGSNAQAERDKLLGLNGAYTYAAMKIMVDAANKPYIEAGPIYRRVEQESQKLRDPRLALSKELMPVYDQAFVKKAQLQAKVEVLRAGASVLIWRAQHDGQWPDTLTQAMATVPNDPFDGQPLRYRHEGSGFAVWSVGKNHFDGGSPNTKPDAYATVFRFPTPAYFQPTP